MKTIKKILVTALINSIVTISPVLAQNANDSIKMKLANEQKIENQKRKDDKKTEKRNNEIKKAEKKVDGKEEEIKEAQDKANAKADKVRESQSKTDEKAYFVLL